MALVGLWFAILGVETHGKAMAVGGAEAPAGQPRPVVLGAETR